MKESNPLESVEGIYKYVLHMLYPGAAEHEDNVKSLAEIAGNYIEAERLRVQGHILNDVAQANTPDEAEAKVQESLDKATQYLDMLVSTEVRNVASAAERDGILTVAASLGIDDPVVYKTGVVDEKLKKCHVCQDLWHSPENIWVPRVYKLSELHEGYNTSHSSPIATRGPSHPNCFLDGRLPVHTSEGFIPLQNVKVGDSVLSHTGVYRKVLATINEPYCYKKSYKISYLLQGRPYSFFVTPDHKFLTQRGWVEAQALTVEDQLVRLVHPCAVCGKESPLSGHSSFGYLQACSALCFSELMSENAFQYHDRLSETDKMIRAANCSEGTHKAYVEGRLKSSFSKLGYWTEERRRQTSDSIKRRMPQMLLASASTRISREQKLAFGWLKGAFPDRNLVLEHPVGNYAIDIAFPDDKLAIEIDGKYHDGDRLVVDEKRDRWLRDNGWLVLRFGYNREKTVSKANIISSAQNVFNNHDGKFSFTYTKITGVKASGTGYKTRIYCLTVEEDESFVVRGIVSHNCRHALSMLPPNFGFDSKGTPIFVSFGYDEYARQHGNK